MIFFFLFNLSWFSIFKLGKCLCLSEALEFLNVSSDRVTGRAGTRVSTGSRSASSRRLGWGLQLTPLLQAPSRPPSGLTLFLVQHVPPLALALTIQPTMHRNGASPGCDVPCVTEGSSGVSGESWNQNPSPPWAWHPLSCPFYASHRRKGERTKLGVQQ